MRTLVLPVLVFVLALACGGGDEEPTDVYGAPVTGEGGTPVVEPTPLPDPPKVIAERPTFPLQVGDKWTWQVTRNVGAGLRVLFLPTEPATSDVIATWELTIDSPAEAGRFKATLTRLMPDQLPQKTDLSLWLQDNILWMQGPKGPQEALSLVVPPEAVAAEKVPCTIQFLGTPFMGVCSPLPGGPLAVPPGPTYGLVYQEADAGRALAQLLVGIGTAGLFIPGNKSASEHLNLLSYVPATPQPMAPELEAWKKSPKVPNLPANVDREWAAAYVVLAPEAQRRATALALFDRLAAPDRVAILRVVLSAEGEGPGRLAAVAQLAKGLGGAPDSQRSASVTSLLYPDDQAAGQAFLEGKWPALAAFVQTPTAGQPKALREAFASYSPTVEEIDAILARSEEPQGILDLVLEKVPAERKFGLVVETSASLPFDDDRLALLKAHADIIKPHLGDAEKMTAIFNAMGFPDGKSAALSWLLDLASADQRPGLLLAAVQTETFDDAKIALLNAHPAVVQSMTGAQKSQVLESVTFDKDEARKALGL